MPVHDLTLVRLLAYIYVRFGAFEKAATLYAALQALDGLDHEAGKGLAWACIEGGHPEAALKALDRIVGPGEPGAVLQLLRARALARLGRAEDAQVAMRTFLSLRAAGGAEVLP